MNKILPTNAGWYALAHLWKVAVMNAERGRVRLKLLIRLQAEGVGKPLQAADYEQVRRDDAHADYLFGLMNDVNTISVLPASVVARRYV